jgi:hypothetical protein
MDTVLQILNSSFFPTVVVASFLGFLNFKQIRAGQQDTTEMQEKANKVSETQNTMQAYKDLYETEHKRRVEAEADLAICRGLVRDDFEKAMRSLDESPRKPKNSQRKEHS